MEPGETLLRAAEREVLEETSVRVEPLRVLDARDAIYRTSDGALLFHYVIVYVEARWIEGAPRAGSDAEEAAWLSPSEFAARGAVPQAVEVLKGMR